MVAAVTPRTQGVVLAVLAAVLLRLAWTGEYLRFVTPWMRWPLLGAGIILGFLALRPLLRTDRGSDHHPVPRSAWLLILPTLVVFAVAPPPLGAFLAERRADQVGTPREPVQIAAGTGPLTLLPGELQWAAAQPDDPVGLAGREVSVTGFVSRDAEAWYVTRLEVFCCAADAIVTRVRVAGQDPPPRDEWVEVVGTWVAGTGSDPAAPPVLEALRVTPQQAPRNTYG